MAFKISRKQNVSVKRVVTKVAVTIIVLWVGGTVLNEIGSIVNGTYSPFYSGLTLIGYTVETVTNSSYANCAQDGWPTQGLTGYTVGNCVTGINGTGILTVVGIVAIASIVLEFIQVKF